MIYCVEDDKGIRELVLYTLQNTGFPAKGFEDGAALFRALQTDIPSLILLDIMLPGEDGISLLRRLRADAILRKIPVMMLTAKGGEYDKVIGLDAGADDYLAKPFGMMELVARVRAILRRTQINENAHTVIYTCGGIVLDEKAHAVSANGTTVSLTLKEYELLRLLLQNSGAVLTRNNLLGTIWGYDFDGETRTIDVHIRTLRQKLGEVGEQIETVRGVGYRLSDRGME